MRNVSLVCGGMDGVVASPHILAWWKSVQFLQRVSIAVSAVLAIVNPSVRPSVRLSVRLSVRHSLALCQNDSS